MRNPQRLASNRFTLKLKAPIIHKPNFTLLVGFSHYREEYRVTNPGNNDATILNNIDDRSLKSSRFSLYMIKPINENRFDSAMEVSGLNWQDLIENGLQPTEAMSKFADWVNEFNQNSFTPIFVAFNAPFDWMFVNDYFHRYIGQNPFGHTALDMKAFYMGLQRVPWDRTRMQYVSNRYLNAQSLSHHALQDSLDQAKIFRKMLSELRNQGDLNG